MKEILDELRSHLVKNIDDYLPFPKPFKGKGEIKAIVVGADPSTNDKIRFETVFDLGGDDKRYFAGIKKNLNAIGLTLDNVYVQNFCQNYFTLTTYKQRKNWLRASGIWYYFLREELDKKFELTIPILATSELILRRLLEFEEKNARFYYEHPDSVPVESSIVISGRNIFPFYRHWRYNLQRPEWQDYSNKLKEYFKG